VVDDLAATYLLQAFSTGSGPLPAPPTFEEMTEVLNRYD